MRKNFLASVVFHDLHPCPESVRDDSVQPGGRGSPDAETSADRRGRLKLIRVSDLIDGNFVRNGALYIQAEVGHVLPRFSSAHGSPLSAP